MSVFPDEPDDDWFALVQTMELDEAERLCRDALVWFKARLRPSRDNSRDNLTIARLNTELHFILERKSRIQFGVALRAVHGKDAFDQVVEWMTMEKAKMMQESALKFGFARPNLEREQSVKPTPEQPSATA